MLTILISIIGILITLLLIIGIHEFSHFMTARLLGIKVLRFSIGFGKSLWSRYDKKGTEYVIAAIPLGGYVKMLDSTEGHVAKEEYHLAFNHQPFYKKFVVVAAGPLSNLVLAFVLYWILFMVGFTTIAPVIGKIIPQSIAAEAGLSPNYEIVKVDHIPTSSWMDVIVRILSRAGDTGKMQIDLQSIRQSNVEKHQLDLSNWHMNNLKPDPLVSLGIIPFEPLIPTIISEIAEDSPAAQAGLAVGDKIILLDNKKINNWIDLVTIIDQHPSETVHLTIERNNKKITIPVLIGYHRDLLFIKHGFLGISPKFEWLPNFLRSNQYGPLTALSYAWQSTYDLVYMNFIIIGKVMTGKISLQSLGGPISIFQAAGTSFHQGIAAFLSFLAFLSISIGIINIFPIPGLDGGHLLFQTIEAIIQRPIPAKILEICYRLGLILLVLLIFQAVMNDILRLV